MVELYNLLKLLNLPLTYHHFTTPPVPPYIVYLRINSENFEADNKVYRKGDIFHIELYSKLKDTVREKLIEDLFDANEIYYEVISELYIATESLYQVIYEITI